ncbi:MAG TPA: SDR family oxidoreductase [Sphingomonas sp.]|jgi:nucleoside-diphosphate-sugar epimerase
MAAPSSRRILLTGASGLLGGELSGLLVDRGHQVTALVRARREVRRNDGRTLPVTDWPNRQAGAAALLGGDIALPDFGLEPATAQDVAQGHDLLVHCAAATGFDLPPAVHRSVNVDGTTHAVGLARRGGLPILHVSTAYAWGKRDGPVAETALTGALDHANGYEASKAEAEAIVQRSGLPHAIARPSIVVGDHGTGAIRAFDTFYVVFRLIARGRVRALPARPDASLDLVPIDHVAAGLADMAERIEEADRRFLHLVSGAPVSVTRFRDAIAAWPQFTRAELVDPARFDPAALSAPERRLHERVLGLYASYFQHDPRFDEGEARAFTGRTCPPTDDEFLHRLAAFSIKAGFVPGAPA